MILAIRFPLWSLNALDIPAQEWSSTVVIDKETVFQAGKKAELSGIRAGMPAEKVTALFEGAILKERFGAMEEAWSDTVSMFLYGLVPQVEHWENGIWFVSTEKDLRPVLQQEPLFKTASIGISSDRLSALLASLKAAENHMLTLSEQKKQFFFENNQVDLFAGLGVSEETIQLLKWTGFETLKKASQLNKRQFQLQFGEEGALLYRIFNPTKEDRQVKWFVPKPEVLLTPVMTYVEINSAIVLEIAQLLAAESCQKLDGKGFQLLKLRVKSKEERTFQKVLKEPVFQEQRLIRLFAQALEQLLPERLDETVVEVRLQLVRAAEGLTGDLFAKPSLSIAIKRVQKRFPGRLFSFRFLPHTLFPEQGYIRTGRV